MTEMISPSEAEVRKTNTVQEKLSEQRKGLSQEQIAELNRADQEATQQRLALVRAKLRVFRGRRREEVTHINALDSDYQPSLAGYRLAGKRPPIDSGHALAGVIGLTERNQKEMSRRLRKYVGEGSGLLGEH